MPTRSRPRCATLTLTALGLVASGLLLSSAPASAGPTTTVTTTGRVSLSSDGGPAAIGTIGRAFLDDSGRFAYFSATSPLQAEDLNGTFDVYRRDRANRTTTRVSLTDQATELNGGSGSTICGLSRDGRFVGFRSDATNLPGSGGSLAQVYLRDLRNATTDLISTSSANAVANTGTVAGQPCPVSDDGKVVAFVSTASNLVNGDAGTDADVFVRRFTGSTTKRVSLTSAGTEATGESGWPSLGASGDLVAFESTAVLTPGDGDSTWDVYVRTGTVTAMESTIGGGGTTLGGASRRPALSADGSLLAFDTTDTNHLPDDDNNVGEVVRKDRSAGTVELASVTNTGVVGTATSVGSTISSDGRFVGFTSTAANLYVADQNGTYDAFRHDFTLDRTDLVSRVAGSISAGNGASGEAPALSSDGSVAAFPSISSNLASGDTNAKMDVFVREFALDIAPFDSLADLGDRGVGLLVEAPAAPEELQQLSSFITNGVFPPDLAFVSIAIGQPKAILRARVVRLYWAFFRRLPDQGGLTHWTNKLVGGTKLATVASQFAASSEFTNTYGALGNQAFVAKIYVNIFDRQPDADGLAYWTKKLDTKQKTRGDVMVSFSESPEGVRLRQPEVDTVLTHLAMLGTMPSKATFEAAVAAQRSGGARGALVAQLRHTPEFLARIGG